MAYSIKGHISLIRSPAILNNEDLASGSYDKTIKIWKRSTYKCKEILRGNSSFISCLLNLKTNIVVSGSFDSSRNIIIGFHYEYQRYI